MSNEKNVWDELVELANECIGWGESAIDTEVFLEEAKKMFRLERKQQQYIHNPQDVRPDINDLIAQVEKMKPTE